MFHATARGAMRKVVEKGVLVVWPVLHPVHFGMGDLLQDGIEFGHVIVSRIAVYHNVVSRSILLKGGLLKSTYFGRTIHQLVIVVSDADCLIDLARGRHAKNMHVP